MKLLKAAPVIALALAAGACSSTHSKGRTVELPGGGPSEPEHAQTNQERTWFERMIGRDDRPNAGPCPLLGALYDASRMVEFASDDERYANIAFTGEIAGVRGLCRYVDANPIVERIEIDMAFGRGAAAQASQRKYRYWVAVTRRGRVPIEKSYFDVDVSFRRGESTVNRTEAIEGIVIPRASNEVSGENFEILVGFDLTPEELQFNRDGKRFKIDAGS
jgi:hypothetical protein